jgi:hypothetical protein
MKMTEEMTAEIEQLEQEFEDACEVMGKKAKEVQEWYKKHFEKKYIRITKGRWKGRLGFVHEVRHSTNMRVKICFKRDRTRFLTSNSRYGWGDRIVYIPTRDMELAE